MSFAQAHHVDELRCLLLQGPWSLVRGTDYEDMAMAVSSRFRTGMASAASQRKRPSGFISLFLRSSSTGALAVPATVILLVDW